jgi:hypothetical protein
VVYQVEASPDLANWSEVLFDSSTPGAPEPEDGWIALDGLNSRPSATPADFFRLRVMLQDNP